MTTTVTLAVNGRYMAKVKQDELDWVEVHGNYEGSPNPEGKRSFNLRHGTSNKFVINEEPVPEAEKADDTEAQAISSEEAGNVKDIIEGH